MGNSSSTQEFSLPNKLSVYPLRDTLFSMECDMPCWRELDANMSDLQVHEYFQDNHPHFRHYVTDEMYSFYYAPYNVGISTTVYTYDNELVGIVLGTPRTFDITINDLLQNLGEPEYVQLFISTGVETRDGFPQMHLYYPTNGFLFYFSLPRFPISDNSETHEICLHGEDQVSHLQILKPDTMENFVLVSEKAIITRIPRLNPDEIDEFIEDMQVWNGTTCYDVPFGF